MCKQHVHPGTGMVGHSRENEGQPQVLGTAHRGGTHTHPPRTHTHSHPHMPVREPSQGQAWGGEAALDPPCTQGPAFTLSSLASISTTSVSTSSMVAL